VPFFQRPVKASGQLPAQLQTAAGAYAGESLQEMHSSPEYVKAIEKSLNGGYVLSEAQMNQLRSRFPLFVSVFSEPGLTRLRTCSPSILQALQRNDCLEEQQLRAYCPVDTWR
jgi:hypothetical protein